MSSLYKLEYLLGMYDKLLYIQQSGRMSKKQVDKFGSMLYKALCETCSDTGLLGRITKYDHGVLQKYSTTTN